MESMVGEWVRDGLLHWLITGGLFMRTAEEEIIKHCPIPWGDSLLRLKKKWDLPPPPQELSSK